MCSVCVSFRVDFGVVRVVAHGVFVPATLRGDQFVYTMKTTVNMFFG